MIAKNILVNTEIVNSFIKSCLLVNSSSDSSWEVFICYDSRDREAIARPLYGALTSKNLKAWYYEESMMEGGNLSMSSAYFDFSHSFSFDFKSFSNLSASREHFCRVLICSSKSFFIGGLIPPISPWLFILSIL